MRTLLPLLLLAACTAEAEDPALHACEQIAEAGTALTAGADVDSGPALDIADEPYTVTLTQGQVGYLTIESAEDTAALLFVNPADVVSGLLDPTGAEVLPAPAPNEDCPDDIPEHFDLDLEPGTWTLALGPAAVGEVWLMLIEAGEHAHE